MVHRIDDVLDPTTLEAVRGLLAESEAWEDGARTAGRHARLVKANQQLGKGGLADGIRKKIADAVTKHPVVRSAARPKALARLIVSRYVEAMTYGRHVDDALMDGRRTDLSFTLFLSDPDTYEGGALVVEDGAGERAFRLPAGSMILYPSTTLHRVEPVTAGERLAAVGWLTSRVRDADRRAILFDLDAAISEVFAKDGKTGILDRLDRTRSNLMRLWADD
ncbi:MAG: Fe2+-dependent dioxygenase [Azospirillaceae bacterium]